MMSQKPQLVVGSLLGVLFYRMETNLIQINNLTPYQVEMLDHMWSLDTEEEFFEWYNLLDEEDQKLADSLQQMVILASVDDIVEQTQFKDAKEALKKFALQR